MAFLKNLVKKLSKKSFDKDLKIEKERYDKRAISNLDKNNLKVKKNSRLIEEPYKKNYFPIIKKYANKNSKILELCAGDGKSSKVILDNFENIFFTDISLDSLKLFKKNHSQSIPQNAQFIKSNIENIPFENNFFDIVVCAGSVSYGDNLKVLNEIERVLKKNGVFICIDSLDDNLIYKINRFIHFLKKERTYSTLRRMPNLKLINLYRSKFDLISLTFHGSFIWLLDPISKILNFEKLYELSEIIDNKMPPWMAFKFVMEAKKTDLIK